MSDRAIVWRIEGEAERVLRERRAFRARVSMLAHMPCDPDAAELIFGELVANTVRHAKGTVEARLERAGDDLVLVVRDHGPGLRAQRRRSSYRDPCSESGRGLAIVAMLARHLAVTSVAGGGTVVRAVLPARAA